MENITATTRRIPNPRSPLQIKVRRHRVHQFTRDSQTTIIKRPTSTNQDRQRPIYSLLPIRRPKLSRNLISRHGYNLRTRRTRYNHNPLTLLILRNIQNIVNNSSISSTINRNLPSHLRITLTTGKQIRLMSQIMNNDRIVNRRRIIQDSFHNRYSTTTLNPPRGLRQTNHQSIASIRT